jgi:hypothetical protein
MGFLVLVLEGVVGLFFGLVFYEGAKASLVDGLFEEVSALTIWIGKDTHGSNEAADAKKPSNS